MDLQQNEFDRILFFEHARKTAEAEYSKNPLDADVSPQFFFFFYFFFIFLDFFFVKLRKISTFL